MNASPAGVTSTLRLVRANSLTPSSLSSDLICRLKADCTTKHRSAARVKLCSSAMATAYLNCCSSTHQS